jgi:hypothetical protein
MTLLPAVRSQLYDAATRRSASPWARLLSSIPGPRPSGRWRRAPLVAIAVGLVLVGGAFGAGLIRLGAPAKTTPIFSNPRAELGALTPGTVRVLPIATPDPAGGPPWGLRVLSTTRGVGCIQVGRLVDGRLGALGQDDAFGNDGRFHELPVSSSFAFFACAALDGNGRIFNNVTEDDLPASAWRGSGGVSKGCVPATASPAERGSDITAAERHAGVRPPPVCPQGDERDLYYGLLGPDAMSITSTLAGHRHTLATVGSEGAYLIVTRAPVHQLLDFADAGTADVVPVDGPITEIHYRDGATCHLTSRSWIGGASACTPELQVPVGYAPVKHAPTRAQVATPLHVRLVRARAGRYELAVSFTSRVALTEDRSNYSLKWHEPRMPPQVNGYESTRADIAAGQTVTMRIGQIGPRLHAGLTSGTLTLVYATGPALLEGPGTVYIPVGSFSVHVP